MAGVVHVVACCMHINLGTLGGETLGVCVQESESVGIGVIFCWCQLARGLQINACMCAHPYVPIVQTKAPSQTPINRLARLVRNKGLRENADFTRKEGAEGVSTFGVYL